MPDIQCSFVVTIHIYKKKLSSTVDFNGTQHKQSELITTVPIIASEHLPRVHFGGPNMPNDYGLKIHLIVQN